jgi:hypothetical protein
MQFRYTPRKSPIKDVLTGILAALVVLAALLASHPAKIDTAHAASRVNVPAGTETPSVGAQ